MAFLAAQKAELRKQLRRIRREQDREALERDSAALCERLLALPELQSAQTVFCYVSYGGEVETHRLIEKLLDQGKTVLVPRCKVQGEMDCIPITSLAELQPSVRGILEPAAEVPGVPASLIEFAVVPAVACGADGSRLGQGGGYYDRFLDRTDCAFAAVCLERFLFPVLPCEAHDRSMKMIVTQHRVLRFEEV